MDYDAIVTQALTLLQREQALVGFQGLMLKCASEMRNSLICHRTRL